MSSRCGSRCADCRMSTRAAAHRGAPPVASLSIDFWTAVRGNSPRSVSPMKQFAASD